MSSPENVAQLVTNGAGVGDLRKLGVSPREIREAGFSIQQMYIFLGIDRLCEAGFSLRDFQEADFPVDELSHKFSLDDILRTGKTYSLPELMKCFSGADLRGTGRYKAADFVSLGNISAADLREFGFSKEEIDESGIAISSSTAVPQNCSSSSSTVNSLIPPNASTMSIGDTWKGERHGEGSTYLKVFYTRHTPSEAQEMLKNTYKGSRVAGSYSYDGSGKHCPSCGRMFVLLSKYTSSDGMCGVESGSWICDDETCGLEKTESYKGYGSIF